MAAVDNDPRYELTWLVRRLFRAMAGLADARLEDTGLTAADRAVMEFLYPDERLPVPAIAARYGVSRQHVQVTVNRLLESGSVAAADNPRHRRSPLYRLTAAGVQRFETIRAGEREVIEQLFDGISPGDVETARSTLATLLEHIRKEETEDGND